MPLGESTKAEGRGRQDHFKSLPLHLCTMTSSLARVEGVGLTTLVEDLVKEGHSFIWTFLHAFSQGAHSLAILLCVWWYERFLDSSGQIWGLF